MGTKTKKKASKTIKKTSGKKVSKQQNKKIIKKEAVKVKNKKLSTKAEKTTERKRLIEAKKLSLKTAVIILVLLIPIFMYLTGNGIQNGGISFEVQKTTYFKLNCENCTRDLNFVDCLENLYNKLDSKEVIQAGSAVGFNNTILNLGRVNKKIYSDKIICEYSINNSKQITRQQLKEYIEANS